MNFFRGLVSSTTNKAEHQTAERTNDPEIKCKDIDVTIGKEAILLNSTWEGSKTIDGQNFSDTVLLETTVDQNSRQLDETLFKLVEGTTELDSEGERIMESIESDQQIMMITEEDHANETVIVGQVGNNHVSFVTEMVGLNLFTRIAYRYIPYEARCIDLGITGRFISRW